MNASMGGKNLTRTCSHHGVSVKRGSSGEVIIFAKKSLAWTNSGYFSRSRRAPSLPNFQVGAGHCDADIGGPQ
jgi:hypothetical protein